MSDNLVFGNPFRELLPYLKQETYLDSLIPELKSYPPPQNIDSKVVTELSELVDLTTELEANPELKDRYIYYDTEFENYIIDKLVSVGANKEEIAYTMREIHDDITPLIVKLKYYFQRIRPYQLAYYYNSALYPFGTKASDTPSYPSGHTVQSKVYCEVLGNIYPKYYNALQELAEDISKSRQYLGVHFKSDCEFGLYCAEVILNHTDFKKKYKL
jgi:hypothetical protein